jgi:TPR repeat protein
MSFDGMVVAILLAGTIAAVVLVRSRSSHLARPRYFSSERKLKRAARWGNTDAQYRLGMACLEVGREEEAFHWLFKSAGAGNARAQNLVGMMYEAGEPVEQNDREAVHWYLESAGRGWPDGQVNAGYMYCLGKGVRKDYAEALKWFERAADAGYPQGKNNLAWLLATCPDATIRDGKTAATVLEPVVQGGEGHPVVLDTLAAAYAEEGMFSEAIALVKEALEAASALDQAGLVHQMELRLAAYENGRPWREPPEPAASAPAHAQESTPAAREEETSIPHAEETPAAHAAAEPAVPEEAPAPHAAARLTVSKKKAPAKAGRTKPAPKKAAAPEEPRKPQPKKAAPKRAAIAEPAGARARATVLRPAPAAAPAGPEDDQETEYKPASWEDVAREFSAALQPEEAPDGGPIDDRTYDEHQKALDFSDSLVEAIIHDRHAEIYRKMERTYRDAVPENQIAPMLEQMYATYGGKPLEAELETDKIDRREYGDGRRAVHKFWYAIRTPKHKKGVYSLFVEIIAQEGRMACSSFFIERSGPAVGVPEA